MRMVVFFSVERIIIFGTFLVDDLSMKKALMMPYVVSFMKRLDLKSLKSLLIQVIL
jgi:hypothetical protein